MLPHQIAQVIDHTFLRNEDQGLSKEEQIKNIKKLIEEAIDGRAFSVCVREKMVSVAAQIIKEKKARLKICSVIGFPKGDNFSTVQKLELLETARGDGAEEFDMVIRVNDLKNKDEKKVYQDVLELSLAANHNCLKVILEMAELNQIEKIKAIELTIKAFQDSKHVDFRFIKTSTGFANATPNRPSGASLEDVALIHQYTKGRFGIKPAGGISTFEEAKKMWYAAGSPTLENGDIDPYLFRIGSNSLLPALFGKISNEPLY